MPLAALIPLHSLDSPAEAASRLQAEIEGQLGAGARPELVAELHFEAAQVYLGLGEQAARSQALEHLWQAFRLRPDDANIRLVLAHCLETEGRLADLAQLYRQSAERCEEANEQTALLARAADIHQRLGEHRECIQLLRRAAEHGGYRLIDELVRATRALLDSLSSGDPALRPVRAEALSLLLGHLRGDERYECALQLASVQILMGDREAACRSYQEALAVRPAAAQALEPALRLLEEKGDHREMLAQLSQALRATLSPPQRSGILRRMARLCEQELLDREAALRYWWDAWEEEERGDEAATLKRLASSLKDADSMFQVLQRELHRAPTPTARVRVLRELAAYHRDVLHDELGAAEAYGFILQLVPDDEEALSGRVEIYTRRRMEAAAAAALRRYAERSRDSAQRGQLWRRVAEGELRHHSRGQLLAVLGQLDPLEAENRELARGVLRQLDPERERELYLGVARRVLEMARRAQEDPARWLESALELAKRFRDWGDRGTAIDCFKQVLEANPGHEEARLALAELSGIDEGREVGPEQLVAQAELAATAHPRRAVRLLLTAVQLLAERPPAGEEERASAAGRALRRAVELCPVDADPELEALEEALRSAGLLQEAADLLRRRADHDSSPSRRKMLLCDLARLLRDQLHDPVRAVEALEQALALDPLDVEIIEQVRELHSTLGNAPALARVLEELLSRASSRAKVPLLEELAALYAEKLHDQSSALGRYGELLALVPDHPRALTFCREHDEQAGDFRSVAVLLGRAAEAAEGAAPRAAIHREIAQIAEHRLGDPDFAIAQWRQVVDLCPAESAPRAEFRRLLARVGRWRELESALLSEVSRVPRPEDKVPIYLDLAAVAGERLQHDRLAARYLRLAHQLAPKDCAILGQLEPVYERLGMWRELASILRRHIEVEGKPEERLKLLQRTSSILSSRLKRDEEALSVCRQICELRPGDRVALALMGEILGRRGQWRERAALLDEQLARESDPRELTHLHLELGRLLLERLQDPEAAAAHFDSALRLDGGRGEVLPVLRRIYEARGAWDELCQLLERSAASDSRSPAERAASLCELARIRELQGREPGRAKDYYQRALMLQPDCLPALAALRAIARGGSEWRELVTLSRRQLELTTNPGERAGIRLEIAETLQHQLGRTSAAAEVLEEALRDAPDNRPAVSQLASIYFESKEWERAAQFLVRLVEDGAESELRHEHYYRLGFALERLGREDEAFSYYVKSFGREPMYLPTLDRLVELCYARRQWDNALRIAGAIVSTYEEQKSAPELAELYLRIGLCELHLAERDRAVVRLQELVLEPGQSPSTPEEAWLDVAESWAATALNPRLLGLLSAEVLGRVIRAMDRVLAHAPAHPVALQILAAIAYCLREWERTLQYVERAVEPGKLDPRQQTALLIFAGDVAAERILSLARSEGYYRRALRISPGSTLAQDRLSGLEQTPPVMSIPKVPPGRPPPIPKPPLRGSATQPIGLRAVTPSPSPSSGPPTVPITPLVPAPRSKPRKPDEEP